MSLARSSFADCSNCSNVHFFRINQPKRRVLHSSQRHISKDLNIQFFFWGGGSRAVRNKYFDVNSYSGILLTRSEICEKAIVSFVMSVCPSVLMEQCPANT